MLLLIAKWNSGGPRYFRPESIEFAQDAKRRCGYARKIKCKSNIKSRSHISDGKWPTGVRWARQSSHKTKNKKKTQKRKRNSALFNGFFHLFHNSRNAFINNDAISFILLAIDLIYCLTLFPGVFRAFGHLFGKPERWANKARDCGKQICLQRWGNYSRSFGSWITYEIRLVLCCPKAVAGRSEWNER